MAKFEPGKSGNLNGRPKGVIDWRVKLRKQIEDAAPDLIDQLITAGKDGDVPAIKLLLDKVLPNLKPQSGLVCLPLSAPDEAGRATEVFQAMMKGEVSTDVGNELISALTMIIKAKEYGELEKRVSELERSVS